MANTTPFAPSHPREPSLLQPLLLEVPGHRYFTSYARMLTGMNYTPEIINGGIMKRAALLVLLLATLAPAAPAPDDYSINVHVTSSYMLPSGQGLDVVIKSKKYQLSGLYRGGILAFGDYKAKLTKDQHPTTYESSQEYEFLFPDNKTRKYEVIGQSD